MKHLFLLLFFLSTLAGMSCASTYTLDQCLEAARNKNLNLKKQESQLKIMSLYEVQSKENFLPKISSQADFTNRTYYPIYNNTPTAEYKPYYFMLEQPLYHFGEFTYKLNQSTALRYASLLDLLEENINVERSIITAYLNVLRQKKLMTLSKNAIKRAEDQMKELEEMVKRGERDPSSIQRWKVLIDTYRDDLVKEENDLATSYVELKRVMQLDVSEEIKVTPLEIQESFEYDYAQIERNEKNYTLAQGENTLFNYAQTFSPAVRRRAYDVMAAENAVSYEVATNYPKIDMVPKFVRDDFTDQTYWQLGVRLTATFMNLPAWETISIRREQLNQVKIDRDIFWRDRKASISTSSYNFRSAVKTLHITTGQVESAVRYFLKLNADYDKNKALSIELVDAYNALYNSSKTRIGALYDFFSIRETLYALIGRSFSLQTPTVDDFMKIKDLKNYYSDKDLYYDYFFLKDMHQALIRNDGAKAKDLLMKYRALIGNNAFSKWSTLHFAAYFDCRQAAEQRLKDGVNVNSMSLDGTTPLYIAVEQGYMDMAQLLIKSGAEVNVHADDEKWTPLMIAASRNYLEIAEILINAGARLDEKSFSGRTALHCAAEGGAMPLVELLIKAGADVNIKTNTGFTAMELARIEGYHDVADYLESITGKK
jgi:outer membrane protein TolC